MNDSPEPALLQLRYDALTRQLERMRSMQYGYFAKFFLWLTLTAGAFLLILWGWPIGRALLPFLVITAGVQASFYLHFVDFARVHAAAVEKRLNRLLGEKVLLGAEIEDVYFYPVQESKFSGIIPTRLSCFFSVFTLHWCVVWIAVFILGLASAWSGLSAASPFVLAVYVGLLALWVVLNTGFLAWYFLRQRDLGAVADMLEESYSEATTS